MMNEQTLALACIVMAIKIIPHKNVVNVADLLKLRLKSSRRGRKFSPHDQVEADQLVRVDQRRNVSTRMTFLLGELASKNLANDQRRALIVIRSDRAQLDNDQDLPTLYMIRLHMNRIGLNRFNKLLNRHWKTESGVERFLRM